MKKGFITLICLIGIIIFVSFCLLFIFNRISFSFKDNHDALLDIKNIIYSEMSNIDDFNLDDFKNVPKTKELSTELKDRLSGDFYDFFGYALFDVEQDDQLLNDIRYYGSYNGYVILFIPVNDIMDLDSILIKNNDTFFFHPCWFKLVCYKNGVFYPFNLSLGFIDMDGILSRDDIAEIYRIHNNYEQYNALKIMKSENDLDKAISDIVLPSYELLDIDVLNQVNDLWYKKTKRKIEIIPLSNVAYGDDRYYGEYNGNQVFFSEIQDSGLSETKRLGDFEINHDSLFEILVYCQNSESNNRLLTIEEAVNQKILNLDDVEKIFLIHLKYEYLFKYVSPSFYLRSQITETIVENKIKDYFIRRSLAYKTDNASDFIDIEVIKEKYFADKKIINIDVKYYVDNVSITKDITADVYEGCIVELVDKSGKLLKSYYGSYHKLFFDKNYDIAMEKTHNLSANMVNKQICFMTDDLDRFIIERFNIFETLNGATLNGIDIKNTISNYSPLLASSYALKHSFNYNTVYPDNIFNDGTDFISQCLLAGKLPMSIYWNYYDYSSEKYTVSWFSSTGLRDCLINNYGAKPLYSFNLSEIRIGDICFIDFGKDGCLFNCSCDACLSLNCEKCYLHESHSKKYDYAMICTGYDNTDGTPIMCCHDMNGVKLAFKPENDYFLTKIHISHIGHYYKYDLSCHRRKCLLCNEYEYQQHIPYYKDGVQRCIVCNAIGPFAFEME